MTTAKQESLSDILYRFSVAISAIKVAAAAISHPRLDNAIVEQAFKVAIDSIDDAYDEFDGALVAAHQERPEVNGELASKTIDDVPDFVFDRLEAERLKLDDARTVLLLVEKQGGRDSDEGGLNVAIRQIYSVFQNIDPGVIMQRPEVVAHG